MRQELLQLHRSLIKDAIRLRQFVDADDSYNAPQFVVLRENADSLLSDIKVALTHDRCVHVCTGRCQRIDGRVEGQLDHVSRQHHDRVKVAEDCNHCRVREVIGRNVNGLERRDVALDTLMDIADL